MEEIEKNERKIGKKYGKTLEKSQKILRINLRLKKHAKYRKLFWHASRGLESITRHKSTFRIRWVVLSQKFNLILYKCFVGVTFDSLACCAYWIFWMLHQLVMFTKCMACGFFMTLFYLKSCDCYDVWGDGMRSSWEWDKINLGDRVTQ